MMPNIPSRVIHEHGRSVTVVHVSEDSGTDEYEETTVSETTESLTAVTWKPGSAFDDLVDVAGEEADIDRFFAFDRDDLSQDIEYPGSGEPATMIEYEGRRYEVKYVDVQLEGFHVAGSHITQHR